MFEPDRRSSAPRRRILTDLSRHNRALILQTLRERGPLPRHELAGATGLSKAATSTLVDGLLSDGRLAEAADIDPARVRGRPVGINPTFAAVVGLELTNDGFIRGVVVDAVGDVLQTVEAGFSATAGPEATADALAVAVRIAAERIESETPLRAAGIAVPGTVDVAEGVVDWLPTTRNWFDVPLQTLLEARIGLPAVVDWRAYTATLAEVRFGAGREDTYVLCLYLGEGIGMGIAEHGAILSGAGNQAGSIAHLQVVSSGGPRCHCGMQGCLWAVASTPAILRRIRDGIQAGVLSPLSQVSDLTLAAVFEAARVGDRLSQDVLEEVAGYVGLAIATCVHVLNPNAVIVAGPLAEAADLLHSTVERVARHHIFPWLRPVPAIRFSQLGIHAAARGVAAVALDRLLGVT
ncbi:MAG: ROK family protein [Chloroflexi bacterium]|nr:ROK family protein [Chloroflexota bacterium]